MKRWLATCALLLAAGTALAQSGSVVGLWKTIDDETGKPKSLVRITEVQGEFSGRIEKLFRQPDEDQNPKCDKCSDARRNQPILGMAVVTGMKRHGDEYSGGELLDPAKGKVYRGKMSLADGGQKLQVRGYIGVPALGRTQTWVRENTD